MRSAYCKVILAASLVGSLTGFGCIGVIHQGNKASSAEFEEGQSAAGNAITPETPRIRSMANPSRIMDARVLQAVTSLTVATIVDVEVFQSESAVFEVVGESQELIDSIKADYAEGNLILSHKRGNSRLLSCGNASASTDLTGGVVVINTQGESKTAPCPLVRIGVRKIPEIKVESSGDVKVMNVSQEQLVLSIHGSGNISADGRVKSLMIQIHGSGDLNTTKMPADRVSILSQGSGDVTVAVKEQLQSTLKGSGDITVLGNPVSLQSSKNGSGNYRFVSKSVK